MKDTISTNSEKEIGKNNIYPISEIFNSLQGEGVHAGLPMTFIRFAGCSVGRPILPRKEGDYIERCTTWSGQSFLCDTNFTTKEFLTTDQIIERAKELIHVNLTGGEPLNRKLEPLIARLQMEGKIVHIETSGTVNLPLSIVQDNRIWIACSPKQHYLNQVLKRADEVKLLVDESFDLDKALTCFGHKENVFLQPINGEDFIDFKNVELCMKYLHKVNSEWKLSIQLHKILKIR